MGHAIELFIGSPRALGRGGWALGNGRVFALVQGFSALTCDREALFEFVGRGGLGPRRPSKRAYFEGDWRCEGPSLDAFGAWLSLRGAVAYVETNYFGGAGDQGACAWREGARIYGPRRADEGVINEALAAIGVVRGSGDEFKALGLHERRSNEVTAPEGDSSAQAWPADRAQPSLVPRPRGPTIRRPSRG